MNPDLTPAELNVLKALWRLRKGTVAEVRDEYAKAAGGEPAYTTVMTLLGRLAAKGAVRVDRKRQPYLYRPAHRADSVLRRRLKQVVDTLFDGHAEALVLHLVDDDALSVEELQRIERKIASRAAMQAGERKR